MAFFCCNKKTQHAQKCRKSEPWLLTTSWLNAQQLQDILAYFQLLLVSRRMTLQPRACNWQKRSRKNAMESLNHVAASYAAIMPNHAAITPNYANARHNCAKIRRNYATSLRHFWLTWPGMCKKTTWLSMYCISILDNKRATTLGWSCPKHCQLAVSQNCLLGLGWSEALKNMLKPSAPPSGSFFWATHMNHIIPPKKSL